MEGKLTNKDKSVVLEHVSRARDISETYLERKKNAALRNHNFLTKGEEDNDEDMQSNEVYSILYTYLAQNELDPLEPTFIPSSLSPQHRDRASILSACAQHDFYVGGYDKVLQRSDKDTPFYGIGIVVNPGYDKETNIPIFKHVSPLSVILDPRGTYDMNTHRFCGYFAKYAATEVMADSSFDHEEVSKMLSGGTNSDDPEELRRSVYLSNYHGFQKDTTVGNDSQPVYSKEYVKNMKDEIEMNKGAGVIYLIDMYMVIYGKKCLVTVDNACEHIVRFKQLKPNSKSERANPQTVPYPMVIDSFSMTTDETVWGINIFDLARANARNISEILNYCKDIIKKNKKLGMLYRKGTVESDGLSYEQDLAIGVPNDEITNDRPLDDIARFMQTQPVQLSEALSMTDRIKQSSEIATGVGVRSSGVREGPGVRTLGQSRILNDNSSILFKKRLIERSRARRDFWKLWLRSHQTNYDLSKKNKLHNTNKKIQAIGVGVTQDGLVDVKPEDFNDDIPEVRVTSKIISRDKGIRKNEAILPLLQQMQAQLDAISFRRLTRKLLENTTEFTPSEVMNYIPLTTEERRIEYLTTVLSSNTNLNKIDQEVHPILQSIHLVDIPTDAGQIYRNLIDAEVSKITIADRDAYSQENSAQNGSLQGSVSGSVGTDGPLNNDTEPNDANGSNARDDGGIGI